MPGRVLAVEPVKEDDLRWNGGVAFVPRVDREGLALGVGLCLKHNELAGLDHRTETLSLR